ncbi:MAG: phosphodiester glycosidase family protein [Lachnospiraceae bacterium]|nr:phosphodiester glycosidase family protein [Lachnospiraceae bacterium]
MDSRKFLKVLGWIMLFFVSTAAVVILTLYLLMMLFCKGPSITARNTFVATMLETGGMKFVVSWYLSEEEVLAITQSRTTTDDAATRYATLIDSSGQRTETTETLADNSTTEDASAEAASSSVRIGDGTILSETPSTISEISEIGLIPISGRTFDAQLLVVRDPSRVSIATSYPWSSTEREKNGLTTGEYCDAYDALAAINAGEFITAGVNWGGRPVGVVVCDGEILFNEPSYGDVMIGFNDSHVLIIKEIGSMTADQFTSYVTDHAIIDAVSFKDISNGDTNHFTKLIENGVPVNLNGRGVGANPRTAIGQCADGTVLFLVTDGRGTAGHLGATGQDLINILLEYGAVNAANLDGGSSSSLYYDGEYRITSSTLSYADASKRLPTAFIVTR